MFLKRGVKNGARVSLLKWSHNCGQVSSWLHLWLTEVEGSDHTGSLRTGCDDALSDSVIKALALTF